MALPQHLAANREESGVPPPASMFTSIMTTHESTFESLFNTQIHVSKFLPLGFNISFSSFRESLAHLCIVVSFLVLIVPSVK